MPAVPRILSVLLAATVLTAGVPAVAAVVSHTAAVHQVAEAPGDATPPPTGHQGGDTPWT
ncbi:hypothetical protein P8A18_01895 [Streptomyces castrisilvae]|uniref:Secreted protein n=1 Tax=Streptomyces castrisilvae TaxID=3033811 RepID=A0ABY9HD19_9ACTN|nr:hypothetical protein [Streptomyces sp. Mut1]WLQ32274.1 hypothetical protein P8A18_01895 [Streptomyces sp. Mut1]